jgi:2-ketocyclohexanecarboxyl-CoA hydrolase
MSWDTLDLFGGTDEAREGIAAFNDRRPPDFSPHR